MYRNNTTTTPHQYPSDAQKVHNIVSHHSQLRRYARRRYSSVISNETTKDRLNNIREIRVHIVFRLIEQHLLLLYAHNVVL